MWNSKSPGVETAWRRSRANFAEQVQFRWPRRSKEPVPRVGPKTHDAGKARFKVAKLHRAQQRGKVSAERPQGRAIVEARVYCHDQEDRGASERRGYWLRNGPRAAYRFGRAHRIGLHLNVILAGRAVLRAASGVRTDSRGCFFGRRGLAITRFLCAPAKPLLDPCSIHGRPRSRPRSRPRGVQGRSDPSRGGSRSSRPAGRARGR